MTGPEPRRHLNAVPRTGPMHTQPNELPLQDPPAEPAPIQPGREQPMHDPPVQPEHDSRFHPAEYEVLFDANEVEK